LINNWLNIWDNNEVFTTLLADLKGDRAFKIAVNGLENSARIYFLAALAAKYGKKVICICPDLVRAEKVYSELDSLFPGDVWLMPPRDFFTGPGAESRSGETQLKRLRYYQWANSDNGGVCVAPFSSFIAGVIPAAIFDGMIISIQTGETLNREALINNLAERGYVRVSLAEVAGQFSARGDIVDIYSPGLNDPIRVEFFDDQVESLRFYDALNQRTIKIVQRVNIIPARELVLPDRYYQEGSSKIKKKLETALSMLRKRGNRELASRLNQKVADHLERLKHPEGLDLLSSYLPFFYGQPASMLDYLPTESLLVVEEPAEINQKSKKLLAEVRDHHAGLLAEGDLIDPGLDLYLSAGQIFSNSALPVLSCAIFPGTGDLFQIQKSYQVSSKAVPVYHGQWNLLKNDCLAWQKESYRVFLIADSIERSRKVINLLEEQLTGGQDDIDSKLGGTGRECPDLSPLQGNLEEGFIIPDLKLVLLTENNLIPRKKKKKRYTEREGIRLSDYRELTVGDYVVHEQHGIGSYQGLHTLEVSGIMRDYLLLRYRGTDKLYLPIDQIGMIQKYSGGEGPAPRLHSLGGAEWQRLKKRVNQSVEELARDLLALYAARQSIKGHSFGADHPWQQDFEASFSYEETPDQLQAVVDVKADLEKDYPMDRLICGDVGYGKTEVAMRAAFKVVMEGKQVAVLVPTTVLAQQHYRTFRERFKGFPVQIAQLSRFVTPAAQKKVINDIEAGRTDIVIGTHRLLSKDIAFNDLGLLVVDEEQRFGVRQKEKMKQLRLQVDTLSMTATPIPRTLHMSLTGARDLSIIETPPENRYPIQTYVVEYSDNLSREAIQRELNREGQVFVVFNRIDRINTFADKIKKLFPDEEVAIGHGRMPEKSLEQVMVDFQEGLYSILVSTTIIESGLDIPNVNTLIIYDADRFGLSQLYQIRGRVGRSNRLAYAYLTYRKNKIISETARKRLKAVKDFTELGSGFKIALRDLEIRGAGNILGAEQHGFIAEVGYDLYVKLLEEAVSELRDTKKPERVLSRLELEIDAFIPSSYILAQDQKIIFYQRIYKAVAEEDILDIKEELNDRYGSPPPPVLTLLEAASLKILLGKLGIESVRQSKKSLTIKYYSNDVYDAVIQVIKDVPCTGSARIISRRPFGLEISSKKRQGFSFNQVVSIIRALERAELPETSSNKGG